MYGLLCQCVWSQTLYYKYRVSGMVQVLFLTQVRHSQEYLGHYTLQKTCVTKHYLSKKEYYLNHTRDYIYNVASVAIHTGTANHTNVKLLELLCQINITSD